MTYLGHEHIHTHSTQPSTCAYPRIGRDGAGVERQEKECRELATRLDWPVAEVFTDNDISASSFSRKRRTDYERLVEAIQADRIDAVITWDSDRMFRQPSEHEPYMKLCQAHDVQNAAVRVGDIDYDTPIGRFNARTYQHGRLRVGAQGRPHPFGTPRHRGAWWMERRHKAFRLRAGRHDGARERSR